MVINHPFRSLFLCVLFAFYSRGTLTVPMLLVLVQKSNKLCLLYAMFTLDGLELCAFYCITFGM